MVIWMTITNRDMITLNEFVHLFCLKVSKEIGYYELIPWDRRSRLVVNLSSSFRYWKSRYFFVSGDGWETLSNDFWGDVPRSLRRWETPQPSVLPSARCSSSSSFLFDLVVLLTLCIFRSVVKECPELESRFERKVQEAIKYAILIEDFDKLVDPRTLARRCFRLEPSLYVL